MSLEAVIGQVQQAQRELSKAVAGAGGWADKQREAFDQQRLRPLNDVAPRLAAALQRAQEKLDAAARLQAD